MYLSPKDIIVDFLRTNLTDPRVNRSDFSNSNTITALGSQTVFNITATSGRRFGSITSVTVDGTAQVKWEDYYIDERNQRIIFFSGISVGASVIVTFKEGATNWIYPDKPNETLSSTSFPRMNISVPTSVGNRLGNFDAPVEGIIRFQVDIWVKPKAVNQGFTIDDNFYTGERLAEYLAYQVTTAFENSVEDLFPALYHYEPVSMPVDLPYNDELQCHHKVVEFVMRGLELGRIS